MSMFLINRVHVSAFLSSSSKYSVVNAISQNNGRWFLEDGEIVNAPDLERAIDEYTEPVRIFHRTDNRMCDIIEYCHIVRVFECSEQEDGDIEIDGIEYILDPCEYINYDCGVPVLIN